ncbi:MAG TPA: ThuA domain-containing protein, partial [Rhodothermales bacterium]
MRFSVIATIGTLSLAAFAAYNAPAHFRESRVRFQGSGIGTSIYYLPSPISENSASISYRPSPISYSPSPIPANSPRILVFSRTTGWRHSSIPFGIEAIRKLGAEHGFAPTFTEDAGYFVDDSLRAFRAVIF